MNPTGGKILVIGAGDESRNGRLTIDRVMNVLTEAGLSPVVHAELPEEHYTPKCIIIGMGSSAEEMMKLHEHVPERVIIITCADTGNKKTEETFIKNFSELKIQRHIPIERLVLAVQSDIIGTPSFEKSVRYPHPKNIPDNKNYSTKPKGLRHGR